MPTVEMERRQVVVIGAGPSGAIAAALLKRVEIEARLLGLRKLFSLTTHSPHWFIERGFVPASPDQLPMQRQQLYNWQRNSKVLVKDL